MLSNFRTPGPKLVTVIVGPGKADFAIFEELLTYHSPYFRAALKGAFKEAQDKTVTLESEDPQIFEFFVHWLFYKRFPNDSDCGELTGKWHNDSADDEDTTKLNNLIHLYVFYDRYQVPQLKTALIEEIFNHIENLDHELAPPDLVSYAFNNLPDKDPLRRLLVDSFVYWASRLQWAESKIPKYPPKFLEKVMGRYTRRMDISCDKCNVDGLLICNYHNHQTEEEKKACSAGKAPKK